MKDWTGNKTSIFANLAASNHSTTERETNDFYATEPKAMKLLLEKEKFAPKVWECACGKGHLSEVLEQNGYEVRSTDLIYRGYGDKEPLDFLQCDEQWQGDIITNPPYKYATDFVYKALELIPTGNKVAYFLKIQFLESEQRAKLFKDFPPKVVYVARHRLHCSLNGDTEMFKKATAVCYCWFVWEKGFKGDPIIDWIN